MEASPLPSTFFAFTPSEGHFWWSEINDKTQYPTHLILIAIAWSYTLFVRFARPITRENILVLL